MHNLPGALFRPKDPRNPQGTRSEILSLANLELRPLYLCNVVKLESHVLRYGLEANVLALPDQLVSIIYRTRSHILPLKPPIRSVGTLARPVRGNARAGSTAGSGLRPRERPRYGALWSRTPEGLRPHYKY